MRCAAGVAALVTAFLSVPAAAQEAEGLRGVWQGTVGDLPVHACFGGGDERGVYYYDRHRELIRLLNGEGEFYEAEAYGDPTDTHWYFREITADQAVGEWSDGSRTLPVQLVRLEWTGWDEHAGPCESGAFMQPRLEGGSVVGEAAEVAGQDYVRLTFVPPDQWQAGEGDNAHEVQISTFVLDDEGSDPRRTNRAINGLLTAHMSRGDMSDAYAQCLTQNIGSHGVDGDFMQELVPELITTRWVGALESNSVYCGGAHPSHWQTRRVFDRNSGEEIAPAGWLNGAALDRELIEAGADSYVYATVTDAFREAIGPHWAEDDELDCSDAVMAANSWDIGLAREGLALIPSLPHVGTPCAETVVLPWADAAPFLTPEGQAVRLSMEAMAE